MASPRDAPVGAQLVLLREPSPLLLHKRELLLLHHGHLTLLMMMVPTPKVSRVVAKASGRHLVLVAPSQVVVVVVVQLLSMAGGIWPRGGGLRALMRVPHGMLLAPHDLLLVPHGLLVALHVTAPAG